MNGINNNVSNSNYNSLGNNSSSNTQKEDKSFFDNVVDSIKDFFDGDEESDASGKGGANTYATSNLDKAYLNSQTKNTYTLAPIKNKETLAEKWAKDNENVALKQKEKEIAKLKQNIVALKSKNKLLSKQNEEMRKVSMPNQNQIQTQATALNDATQSEQASTQAQNQISTNDILAGNTTKNMTPDKQKEEPVKKYDSIPTHTTIPKKLLEQQQNEVDQIASNTKVEAPKKTEKVDDTRAQNIEDKRA